MGDGMERARRMVQSVFYYVEQAFPRNKGRLTQYGKDRYAKAAKDPEEMRLLLDMAAEAAERECAVIMRRGSGTRAASVKAGALITSPR